MVSANLNPVWNEEVELPINDNMATYRFECILWDHDKFTKKDYLGEFNVNLKAYFANHPADKATAQPKWHALTSFRKGKKSSVVSGAVELKIWLEDHSNPGATDAELRASWSDFVTGVETHEGAKFALAAPDRPVGMHMAEEEEEEEEDSPDEGLAPLPGDDNEDESDVDTVLGGDSDLEEHLDGDVSDKHGSALPNAETKLPRRQRKRLRKMQKRKPFHFKTANTNDVSGVIFLEIDSAKDLPREKNMTKTGFDMDPFVITSFSKKTFRTRVVRHSLNPFFHDKLLLQVHKHEEQYSLKFTVVDRDKLSGNDYVGDCDLPVQELIRFGPQADSQTGLYQLSTAEDTPTSAPVRKRRLLGVRKLTRTNTSGSTSDHQIQSHPEQEHLSAELAKLETSNSAGNPDHMDSMRQFNLPIRLARQDFWGDKHNPTLQFKAKFVPYPALRQQFWRVILRHFDAEEDGCISRVELTTMLDSLGATQLRDSTIDSFFRRFAKSNCPAEVDLDGNATTGLDDTMTIDQCVICLEDHLNKGSGTPGRPPVSRTASTSSFQSSMACSSSSSSVLPTSRRLVSSTNLKTLQTLGPSRPSSRLSQKVSDHGSSVAAAILPENTRIVASRNSSTRTSHQSNSPTELTNVKDEAPTRAEILNKSLDDMTTGDQGQDDEYLISLTVCPLCQNSNMDKKSATDIVTHLATCASQDWRKVNHLVMGDFVTPSQAQRKWYTKVISKVGYGGYKIGANTANILVQDRKTGHVQEERMSVYVRLGIRLLYKGMKSSRMETSKIRKMLRSMSIKQGRKYDSPVSTKDIRPFIAFHRLNLAEVLHPVDHFKSFNEFFYRELKPGSRPCAQPDDPRYLVSPADCRSVVFNTISEATEIWVKGQQFSLRRLFGDAYASEVDRFQGGSLGIFRLAPQDYHRFHIPVDGVLGEPKAIEGQYYTVNPMAIRSNLDVYGENIRVLVPIDSPIFGRVMIVCVGAMMVGSTIITAKPHSQVSRTDELGYFKFGGSTLLLIFEPGKMVFDEDLILNAKSSVETLLRVGSSIGHPPGIPDALNESSEPTTEEDKAAAGRAIAGHHGGDGGRQMSLGEQAKEAFATHNAM